MIRLERKGGEKVGPGTYWDTVNGDRIRLERAGVLPGDASKAYFRFHPLLLLVVGPLMGLVYAIFLPLSAIVMVLSVLGEKLAGGAVTTLRKAASFSWRPSEAYLTGRRKGKNQKAGAKKDKPSERG